MPESRPRSAIVTGAAGQIGSAVARRFASQGLSLHLIDRERPDALADELRDAGADVEAFALDVRNLAEIRETVIEIEQSAKGIGVLVNVAGIATRGSTEDVTEEKWEEVVSINLKGTFFFCQAVLPVMRRQKYGRIVNIGSVLGKNGGNPRPWIDPEEQKRAGDVAYGISKAGVHAMTSYLAKEVANQGITVNAVAPGVIASPLTTNFPKVLADMIPVGRMGTAEEVAYCVSFLAGDEAGFVTGEVLDVNGAMWCD